MLELGPRLLPSDRHWGPWSLDLRAWTESDPTWQTRQGRGDVPEPRSSSHLFLCVSICSSGCVSA